LNKQQLLTKHNSFLHVCAYNSIFENKSKEEWSEWQYQQTFSTSSLICSFDFYSNVVLCFFFTKISFCVSGIICVTLYTHPYPPYKCYKINFIWYNIWWTKYYFCILNNLCRGQKIVMWLGERQKHLFL
jgi:hypothetical protein